MNTSAEVKAEFDLCRTSANAVMMVREVLKDAGEIIFAPDQYPAVYVATQSGRLFITWCGFHPTRLKILQDGVKREETFHPEAVVIVYPECRAAVTVLAGTSVSGIIRVPQADVCSRTRLLPHVCAICSIMHLITVMRICFF